MFDLKQFEDGKKKQEEGVEIDIFGPKGEKTDIKMTIVSYESDRSKAVLRRLGNAQLLKEKRSPRKATTVQENEKNLNSTVASVIVGWSGMALDGKEFVYSEENAETLVKDYPFIAEQVDAAAGDRTLFF